VTPPLISAVLMTYNRPLFVRQAIKLFLAQTWPRKELLILDDGPEGQVPSNLPSEIRHIRCPRMWMTYKRAIGYAQAQGDFVAGFDDDDYYGPRRLEVQAKALASGLDACGFHMEYIARLPGPVFYRWKNIWPGNFHDNTILIRRPLLMRLPRKTPDECYWPSPREVREAGGTVAQLKNDGHFLYVVHGHNAWGRSLDLAKDAVPTPPPAFVPEEMKRFWEDPALDLEGRGGTWANASGKT